MFKRKNKENEFHQELIEQIKGLINIDIGCYLYNVAPDLELHIESYGGIDIYIFDKDFAYLDEYKQINFKEQSSLNIRPFHESIEPMPIKFKVPYWIIDDKSMIGHYHREDLLWLIMNYEKEKEKMIKQINGYVNWKRRLK